MENCFGERLKRLRKNAGMTQADVSSVLGKSSSTVRMWELGINEPDINTLVRLSLMFDASLDYLLCRDLVPCEDGTVRTGLPVYRLSAYSPDQEPEFFKSIPSDYLTAGGSFFMLLNDTKNVLPLIPEGAAVLIKRQDSCLEGQIAFVKYGSVYMLRKVNFYDGGIILTGSIDTTQAITAESDSGNFEIIGIAVEYTKTL